MSNPYRYPERGHVYRHCLVCGRPFRVGNSQLARRSARFCTVRCYRAALRAFSEALASDRWGPVKRPRRQRALWRNLEKFGAGDMRLVDARTGFSCVVPARTR
jgi:hypothetical protein